MQNVSLDASAILENTKIFKEFRGSLTKQFILQEIETFNDLSIFYWKCANSEVDFIIQKGSKIILLEVKTTINLKIKSLKAYIDKYQSELSIRTSL